MPPVHHLRDGRRLLSVSVEVLRRVPDLAYAFRMTGRKDYADRAWTDLNAAASFKDWNPAHFLDTAVMTAALAIGYDWLWDQWSPEQRARLRESIVRLGLKPAMKDYQGRNGWHKVDYNWNQVCNGGIAMGALAVAVFTRFESTPSTATAVLDLTGACKMDAESVRRTFSLVRGISFTVADEITATKPAEVRSFFHTQAGLPF